MNKGILVAISGVVGAGIGSAATAIFYKRKLKDVPTAEETERYINEEIKKAVDMLTEKYQETAEEPDIMPKPVYGPAAGPKAPNIGDKKAVMEEEHVNYHNMFEDYGNEAPSTSKSDTPREDVQTDKKNIEKPKPVGPSTIITFNKSMELEDRDGWSAEDLAFYYNDGILCRGELEEEEKISLESVGLTKAMLNTTEDALYFANESQKVVYTIVMYPERYDDIHPKE